MEKSEAEKRRTRIFFFMGATPNMASSFHSNYTTFGRTLSYLRKFIIRFLCFVYQYGISLQALIALRGKKTTSQEIIR
jgi:hypothetical protein